MKWTRILGALVVSLGLCSTSDAAGLLQRMLGSHHGCCDVECCETSCCDAEASCCYDGAACCDEAACCEEAACCDPCGDCCDDCCGGCHRRGGFLRRLFKCKRSCCDTCHDCCDTGYESEPADAADATDDEMPDAPRDEAASYTGRHHILRASRT